MRRRVVAWVGGSEGRCHGAGRRWSPSSSSERARRAAAKRVGSTVAAAFLKYDPGSDRWSRLPLPDPKPPWPLLASAPSGLIAYQHSQEGGVTPELLFDPATGTWTEFPPDPLRPSYDRTIVPTDSGIVLIGMGLRGSADPGPPLYGAAALDPRSWQWGERFEDAPVVGWSPTWYDIAGLVVNPAMGSSDGGDVDNWGRSHPHGGMLDPVGGEWLPLPDPPDGRGRLVGYSAAGDRYVLDHGGCRKLKARVPPPEPADRWNPTCGKGFRLRDYLGQSG